MMMQEWSTMNVYQQDQASDEAEYIREHNERFIGQPETPRVNVGSVLIIDGQREVIKRKFIDHFHAMVVFESGKIMFSSDVNYGIQMGKIEVETKATGDFGEVFVVSYI
jgi:hypothetical protein